MIKVLFFMVYLKLSRSDELEEILSQHFPNERTSPVPTVSSVAQFFTSDSSNFTEITQSDFFVDKTLLIKDLLDNNVSPFLEISAAPHFGKSTNLDMVKRYLEINVDKRGLKVKSESSDNYKTFTNSLLKITKHKQVFDSHFGKYPIVSINYKLLETVTKFDPLLRKCKEVLFETFSHHHYLLQSESFWNRTTMSKNDFVKYSHDKSNPNLTQSEIEEGFSVLAQLLFEFFKTPVVVLVDDYDVIVDAPVSEDCRDAVFSFIVNMTNQVVESRYVSRVLLTGSLLRGGIPHSPRIKSALHTYPHLLKHYGLDKNEVHSLLKRVFKNSTEIEEAERCIVKNYSGYVRSFEVYDELPTNPRKDVMCSVWSVIQYLTCVRKINIGNIGEPLDGPSLTYLSVADRGRIIKTF